MTSNDVMLMSMRRDYVASTSVRRHVSAGPELTDKVD